MQSVGLRRIHRRKYRGGMAQLRHLALRCGDLDRSRTFYETALGWKFLGFRPSGEALDLTDGVLNITLIDQPPTDRRPYEEGEEFIHFGVVVDDLDAVWKRLHELGVAFSKESVKERKPIDPSQPPPVSFKVLDPDGNVVDITSNRSEWVGVRLDD
jgi:catechol 2,3-dioxygenase-like lactoylglutathione lyase family enzyme